MTDVVCVAFHCPFSLQVQLQLLTATVKLFLKKPTESGQRMISQVLSAATNESDNPDLRDRAYIYWRLLSTDPEVGACTGAWMTSAGRDRGRGQDNMQLDAN